MATDYEKVYQEQRHALGDATSEIITFFEQLNTSVRVLDAGCGQGRDALAIARLGHQVVGVDLSPSGIQQLMQEAKRESLNVQGIDSDLLTYKPAGKFDIILFDRTLHMLSAEEQLIVLRRYCKQVADAGFILINDLKKNLPAFEHFFTVDQTGWLIKKKSKGFLFVQMAS